MTLDKQEATIIRVSNRVISQDSLDIDYHSYLEPQDEANFTPQKLIQFYKSDFKFKLRRVLGSRITKFFLTLPDNKKALTPQEQESIPESKGSVNNHMTDLLLLPATFSLIEKPIEDFQATIRSIESAFQTATDQIENPFIEKDDSELYDFLTMRSEADNQNLFFDVLKQIIELMRLIDLKPVVLINVHTPGAVNDWLEGDESSPPLTEDPDVKPNFLVSTFVEELYLQIPFEVKRNLKYLVSYLESSTKIKERTMNNKYTIIQQCLHYAIKYQSPGFVVTDYFYTIYFQMHQKHKSWRWIS